MIPTPTPYGGAPGTRRRCTTGPVTSGKLKAYHQEIPHDAWDFDSAVGEFMMVEKDGKKYVVHPGKSGWVWVYDRMGKVQNVYRGVDNINFVKDITKTGELIGRRDLAEG